MSRYSVSPSSLTQMTAGRSLPWLRCSPMGGANDPSTTWAVPDGEGGTRAPLYRELVVLNHRGEVILGFDLAANPIDGNTHAAQRTLVKEALRTAAALPDTDGDRLPDAWEIDEFGRLDAVAADSPTSSGLSALLAYAFGQSPHAARDSLGLRLSRSGNELALTYTRRLARRPNLLWTVERTENFTTWLDWLDLTGGVRTTQYDGTGTERVTHPLPGGDLSLGAFRLRLAVGTGP